MEQIRVDIGDLENAYTNVIEAMNNINDVEGLDEEYRQLDLIAQAIDKKKLDLQTELDYLEEEAFYKENELKWKEEQEEQEREYRRMVL